MDKTEFATIAAALRTYFPRYNMFPNEEAMSLWYQELQDVPAEVLGTALRKWVATNKWPPSIAELRESCAEVVKGKVPDWGEAWAQVTRAIRRYGYARPEEAMESMQPTTRAAVERIGWTAICESENPETIRAQFRQVYEISAQREVEDRQLPESVKGVISGIAVKLLGGGS